MQSGGLVFHGFQMVSVFDDIPPPPYLNEGYIWVQYLDSVAPSGGCV